jgi:hypothetical protein
MLLIRKSPGLVRQKNAPRVDEIDTGKPVLHGDFLRPHMLLDGHGEIGPAFDRGIVGHDQDLPAVDNPDAGDHARRWSLVVVHSVGSQRTELQERSVAVEKALQPLPDQELFSGLMEFAVLGRTPLLHFGQPLLVLGDNFLHLFEVVFIVLTLGIDLAFDLKHGHSPPRSDAPCRKKQAAARLVAFSIYSGTNL